MKSVQILFRILVMFGYFSAVLSGCSKTPAEKALEEIRVRKILRVAVKPGMPGLCEVNAAGEYSGMEAILARLLAQTILGPSGTVAFVETDAQNRNILLDSGEVDMVIANFTITEERKRRFVFSPAYYTGSAGFMVKKNSDIKTLSALDGKRIGVVRGSTTVDSIHETLPDLKIATIFFAQFSDIKAALDADEVDAFSVDIPILRGFLDDTVMLLSETVDHQPYGIAIRPFHTELAKEVNANIEKWLADGTIAKLIVQCNL